MAAERDLDKLLQIIRRETEHAVHAERCTVFLYDAETNELWSRHAPAWITSKRSVFPPIRGWRVTWPKPVKHSTLKMLTKIPALTRRWTVRRAIRPPACWCIPMRNQKGDIIGVFQVLNKKNAIFQRTDEELLIAIASSAGIALENAQLYKEQKTSFESFVKPYPVRLTHGIRLPLAILNG